MSKRSQAELARQLRDAQRPLTRRDLALELLSASRDRDKIDLALRALLHEDVIDLLDDTHCPVLRDKARAYFDNPKSDRGGLIREQLIQLLTAIGHPDDIELYKQGCVTYYRQPSTDTAQNLRAAALVGLAGVNQELSCAYAVRLLGEPDTSELNGQPSITAINVLVHNEQRLPIYHFVLRQGQEFLQRGSGEVVARALEVLAVNFPADLYRDLVEDTIALDIPVTTGAIVSAITGNRLRDLYPLLERIITTTRHDDLHHYTLVMLAAGRDKALTEMLYRLARSATPARARDYIEAIDLTFGDERDDLLDMLKKRARK